MFDLDQLSRMASTGAPRSLRLSSMRSVVGRPSIGEKPTAVVMAGVD